MRILSSFSVVVLLRACVVFTVHAQCVSFQGIEFTNASFEGPTGSHITPAPWLSCFYTPDTQPGSWGETQIASDGNTYVGLVYGGPNWQEGLSQQLESPLIAGTVYGFTVDLSGSTASGGGIDTNAHGLLEVWASDSICTKTELLWSSPIIEHMGWQTYDIQFNPSQNYSHIYFLNNGQQEFGYLLMDNLSNFEADSTVVGITSHEDSALVDCRFDVFGFVDEAIIDSIVLVGNFNESPYTVLVSDSLWITEISFSNGGIEMVTASAYFTDFQGSAALCLTIDVIVDVQAPEPMFTTDSACLNAPLSFLDQSTAYGSNTLTSWQWDFGDGNSSIDQHPIHQFNAPGIYPVELEVGSSDGCFSDTTFEAVVFPTPLADFTFTEVCLGHTTNFHDFTLPFGGTIVSWQWDFGNGDVSMDENPVYTYPSAGAFEVELMATDLRGCSDSLSQIIEVFLCNSIDEPLRTESITIYPNPSSEMVTINAGSEAIVKITLYDVLGKHVMSINPTQNGTSMVKVPVNLLTYGIYQLELQLGNQVSTHHQLMIK